MRTPRLYQAANLAVGHDIPLSSEALHYLLNVLRLKSGDPVIIFNGLGGEYHATLAVISKRQVVAHITAFIDKEVESVLSLHLALGMVRGEKMDLIIQKAVELGVNTITPLYTQYSQAHLSHARVEKRLSHWAGIVVSACEQCGRNRLPTVVAPIAFSLWLATLPATAHKIIFDPLQKSEEGLWPSRAQLRDLGQKSENEGHDIKQESKSRGLTTGSIDLFTINSETFQLNEKIELILTLGPEGGFSAQEVAAALRLGFVAMRLGPRILRVETAAIVAVAAAQAWWGDWG